MCYQNLEGIINEIFTHKYEIFTHECEIFTHKYEIFTHKYDIFTHKYDIFTHILYEKIKISGDIILLEYGN